MCWGWPAALAPPFRCCCERAWTCCGQSAAIVRAVRGTASLQPRCERPGKEPVVLGREPGARRPACYFLTSSWLALPICNGWRTQHSTKRRGHCRMQRWVLKAGIRTQFSECITFRTEVVCMLNIHICQKQCNKRHCLQTNALGRRPSANNDRLAAIAFVV